MGPEGSMGKPRYLSWKRLQDGAAPTCAENRDKIWLEQLASNQGRLEALDDVDAMLDGMVNDKRLVWETLERPLGKGRKVAPQARWRSEPDGDQTLLWTDQRGHALIWLPHCMRAIDPDDNLLLAVTAPWPDANVSPRDLTVSPEEAGHWREQFESWGLTGPEVLPISDGQAMAPVPVVEASSFYGADGNPGHRASFWMQYGDARVDIASPRDHLFLRYDGEWIRIPRSRDTEDQQLKRAADISWRVRTLLAGPRHTLPADQDWIDWVLLDVPTMTSLGWHIHMNDNFAFRIVTARNVATRVRKPDSGSEDLDWFGMSVDAEVAGAEVNLLPLVLEQLDRLRTELSDEQRPPVLLTLDDGRKLSISRPLLRSLVTVIVEIFGQTASRRTDVRINRQQLAKFLGLEAFGKMDWGPVEDWRQLVAQLLGDEPLPPVEPGKTFRGELRGYQQEGLAWLHRLHAAGMGGVLADDMGLGKTIQAIALITRLRDDGQLPHPVLILAPTSVLYNWENECHRFAPALKVSVVHGDKRGSKWQEAQESDVIITSYPLVLKDWRHLQAFDFSLLVLDEAQVLKNPRAKTTQQVNRIRARLRFALTGTPLENHLGELWTLFQLVLPQYLGSMRQFQQMYRRPIEQNQDVEIQQHLSRRIAPFMKRRTKRAVAVELPEKNEMIQWVTLNDDQRMLYETIRLAMRDRVRLAIREQGLEKSQLLILDALLKLRQLCCHPKLVKLKAAQSLRQSAKTDWLLEMLREMVAEGRRILVFSQFTQMLDILAESLDEMQLPWLMLTGKTRHRQALIDKFQDGQAPIFLISLKAGGTGLNLTAADSVIHYDPWWNPAVEDQATDRAHRIGQDKTVFVYRLICKGTVEEKIQALQNRKRALYDAILQPATMGSMRVSEDELEWLFSPLES